MSYIAATLLINMPALDAFIALCNVLHHPLHQAFFRMDAVELRRYFAAFEVLLGERLPRVAQVFREQAIDVSMFLLDW